MLSCAARPFGSTEGIGQFLLSAPFSYLMESPNKSGASCKVVVQCLKTPTVPGFLEPTSDTSVGTPKVTSRRNSCMNSVSLPCQPSCNAIIACDSFQLQIAEVPRISRCEALLSTAKAHAENRRLERELKNLRALASRQRGEARAPFECASEPPWNAATMGNYVPDMPRHD